ESANCGSCYFINAGLIRKSGGTGNSDISGAALVYQGTNETLDAGGGTLRFASPSGAHTHSGLVTLIGNVQFVSGNHTFADGSRFSGELNLSGSEFYFPGVFTV